ncbi:MAG: hypothetical protein FWF33_05800 [Clostridiales bacterium]|nr:hypothetical protein [Clostridiales bacterium]
MADLFALADPNALMAAVSAIIYLILLGGALLLFRRRIAALLFALRGMRRLPSGRAPGGSAAKTLFSHLDSVLAVTLRGRVSAQAFLIGCVILFFVVFIVSAKTLPALPAFVTGAAFAGLPYLFLRMRLERYRRAASFEGEKLMGAFLTGYLIAGGNIYLTIERVIRACPELKTTGGLLRTLLASLRLSGDPARIRREAERFSFGIGTSWSSMLANVIVTGAVTGSDMTAAIEDILAQLREARALAEERKRMNGESVRMAAWLTPGLYVGSVFVAVFMIGIPPARFLHNQFFTPGGFSLFSIGLFLFLVNRILLEVLVNRKLDF